MHPLEFILSPFGPFRSFTGNRRGGALASQGCSRGQAGSIPQQPRPYRFLHLPPPMWQPREVPGISRKGLPWKAGRQGRPHTSRLQGWPHTSRLQGWQIIAKHDGADGREEGHTGAPSLHLSHRAPTE
jgi:hypothetical protein